MRKSIIIFFSIIISFSIADAQTGFRVEFTPLTNDAVSSGFLVSNSPFTVNIYHTNSQLRTGWSTPFVFYGTGTVNLTGPGTHSCVPGFCPIWTMGTFESEESWDGDIQNNAGGMTGDLWNYSGLTLAGYQPGPEILIFSFEFDLDEDNDNYCETVEGLFCVDSGDFVDNTYDWLFSPPEPFGDPYCVEVKKLCCLFPTIDNCPNTDITMQWDEQFLYQFEGDDWNGPPLILDWAIVDGPGSIDENGVYTFNPTCNDVGSHTVEVVLTNHCYLTEHCTFTISVLNTAPEISGDCGREATIGTLPIENKIGTFTSTDSNIGDVVTFTTEFVGVYIASANIINGELFVVPTGVEGTAVITINATDCAGATASCQMTITVGCCLSYDILIQKVHDAYQGHHTYVDVYKYYGVNEIHGFDFLIGYDASALTFMGAEQGQILTDLEWEYFTYRYGWNGNCGNGCPSGLLRVVAMGETNDGAHNPLGYHIPDGEALFALDFLVTNDRNFGGLFVPVYFYWMDCGDNTIAFHDATSPEHDIQTAVSDIVYHYGGNIDMYGESYYEVDDMFFGFPTYFGVQYECLEGAGPDKPAPIPYINFFGGGVDIIHPDDIDDRGDINLNGVSNEVADAVVFTNYFIYGLAAFVVNVEGQIAATEVNGDGIILTVADLVYLVRIITGDAPPYPKLTPGGTLELIAGETIVMNAEIGAAAFVFEGNAKIELGQGAQGMDLLIGEIDGNTTALVYSMNKGQSAAGEILKTIGNLIKADVSDYAGNAYKVSIIPDNFAVSQNYPNPFNPTTMIEMSLPSASDYTLTIYNIAGQKVWEQKGYHEAGSMTFNIDLTNQASGVYFYKIDADDFSDTKKMVLMK